MKLAIMQPYFFPYIGYFQLIDSVDMFVLFDSVNYIKKGWINRNSLGDYRFTIPLNKPSQNVSIRDTTINESYTLWKKSFLKTLEHLYKKKPTYPAILPRVMAALNSVRPGDSISLLNKNALQVVCDYLDITTPITNAYEHSKELKGQDLILDICLQKEAHTYHNSYGGKDLYEGPVFKKNGCILKFIYPNPSLPKNSLLELLFTEELDTLKNMLKDYRLQEI